MSDFLSKFSKDKYEETVKDDVEKKVDSPPLQEGSPESGSYDSPPGTDFSHEQDEKEAATTLYTESESSSEFSDSTSLASNNEMDYDNDSFSDTAYPVSTRTNRRDDSFEDLEIDPTYQKRKRRNIIIAIAGSVLGLLLILFIYYQMVHAEMEDFVGLPVSDARAWASENDMEMELNQEYSTEYETNQIMSQSIASGEKVRKGSTINITSSQGPDPDETLPLPEFSELSQWEIETWIADNHANNLSLLFEYSDEIDEGEFIRLDIRDSGVTEADYRRRDRATVYISRGEEQFEKNIDVPDFTGLARSEVEQWAESNSIEVTYEEQASKGIEAGMIISQSINPEEKVAKNDSMKVVVSLGKAIEVPDFSSLSMEEAQSHPDLVVTMRQRFHASVPYGGLISQSIEAGSELTANDDVEITVVYSEGRPYLRDYHGQLEGDLPRLFYDDYQSKGANIKYIVKFVDSTEAKGTVVGMGKFNEFVPMEYTVEIRVSNNSNVHNGQSAAPPEWDPGFDFEPEPVNPPEETDEDLDLDEDLEDLDSLDGK